MPGPPRPCAAAAACRRPAPAACWSCPSAWTGRRRGPGRRSLVAPSRVRFLARGCGRVAISVKRPPTPMPMMAPRSTGTSAARRCSTQSKPLSLGERAQPGRPSTGTSPCRASSSRLPGSTGMPKCSTVAARLLDAGRQHVAAIGDGRGTGDQQQVAPLVQRPADLGGERLCLVRAAGLGQQVRRRPRPSAPR